MLAGGAIDNQAKAVRMKPRIILAGAGQTGQELARRLVSDWTVVVVDLDASKQEKLPEVEFFAGDATSSLVLQKAMGEGAMAAVAVTGRDDVNLEFCRLARVLHKIPRVLACLRQSDQTSAFDQLGVVTLSRPDAVVSALQSRLEHKRTTSEVGLGKGEIVEVTVLPHSPVIGKRMLDLSPQSWLVAAIYRKGQLVVPHGQTTIEEGDNVLLVGDPAILPSIANFFRAGQSEFPLQFGGYVVAQSPQVWAEATYLSEHTHALGCVQHSQDPGCLVMHPPQPNWRQYLGLEPKKFILSVEAARVPVLLARGTYPYDDILVAVSPGALREVELAIDVARVLGIKRISAAVVLPPAIVTGVDRIEQLRSALQGAVKMGELYRVEVAAVALEGNPVSQILQFARRYRLLVMGHRPSRHSLTKPDVSRLILSRSPISTLVACSAR